MKKAIWVGLMVWSTASLAAPQMMMDAANAYMAETGYEWKFRFDIISVVLSQNGLHKVEHIEDAFFPGW